MIQAPAKPKSIAGQNAYQQLVSDISEIYQKARRSLAEAYWNIGKRIVEVEQGGEARAPYGSGLLPALSKDLTQICKSKGFSVTNLKRIRRIYLKTPIRPTSAQLDWSQQVALLPLEDPKKRREIEKKAVEKKLTSREIRKLVRKEKSGQFLKPLTAPQSPYPFKRPKDLRLLTCAKSILRAETESFLGKDKQLVDCGFFVTHAVLKSELKNVTLTDKPSFTYAAIVERVIDGDTLWLQINVGFGAMVREKIRLRGIDTPELGTSRGEEAKQYVTKELPPGTRVVVKSYRTDTYGRFVADLFYQPEAEDFSLIAEKGVWLNETLFRLGFAVIEKFS